MLHVNPDRWTPKGVESLESAAEETVRSQGNTLVVAGPGAGKTELLAQRACFLLETATCRSPHRILAISFKRDAAKNLQERVAKRCGDNSRRFESMTLDAFGKSLVDRFRAGLPERWRPRLGYEVLLKQPRVAEIREWFLSIPTPVGMAAPEFRAMSDSELRSKYEICQFGCQLPIDDPGMGELRKHYATRFWEGALNAPAGTPSLSFPMLNRLAAFLLRQNPKLLAALRTTYSHVFMDEYQDTTASQYDLVQAAFQGSAAVMTAVGDSKQMIMGWAGAMADAFERFEQDFHSEKLHLVRNYRSTPELVRIQHVIAEAIEKGTPPVEAVKASQRGSSCSILEFASPEDEARYLSELIAREIQVDGLKPRDFCILARQKTAEMIEGLGSELAARAIPLRDETILQDLLTEPLTQLSLALLRLAIRPRDPEAWDSLTSQLAELHGYDAGSSEDGSIKEAERLLAWTETAIASPELDIQQFPTALVGQIGESLLRTGYRQYRAGPYLTELAKTIGTTLSDRAANGLPAAVNELVRTDTVPAMTVHKSKGLEFHTVVFLGLEASQLWNFANQSEEEIRGFFVAFSRAIHRVFFTFSDVRDGKYGRKRQDKQTIKDLYTLLQSAGVQTIDLRSKSRFASQ